MDAQFRCGSDNRRMLVDASAHLNGIDVLEVLDRVVIGKDSPRQRTLLVRCFKELDAGVDAAAVRVDGGVRVTVRPLWAKRADGASTSSDVTADEKALLDALPEPKHVLVVRTDSDGDFSTYRLRLVGLGGFDPILSSVEFSFKVECPTEFDCRPVEECAPEAVAPPAIDYQAKDWASFRRLMLDRMAAVAPAWSERNVADLGVLLVETLAHAADHVSYYQDAVATEAYLATARRRVSVRRHARLLDYLMHEGCNARAWLRVSVAADATLAAGTTFLTRCGDEATRVDADRLEGMLSTYRPQLFESLDEARLRPAHNEVRFHTWSETSCCLPRGATRATLRDDPANPLRLAAGDVLIFEEVKSPSTGRPEDADPVRRCAVRLSAVTPGIDPLTGAAVVDIAWGEADALPVALRVSAEIAGVVVEDLAVARGNVVLVDHGRSFDGEALDPPVVPGAGAYRPTLARSGLVWSCPWEAEDRGRSATEALAQDPRRARPSVELVGDGALWSAAPDLLASDRFATEFVVEMEDDGTAWLRFGDDVMGRRPSPFATLEAFYRTGGGSAGNVGAGAIFHVVTRDEAITAATNPMAAIGGVDRESIQQVKQYAPQAFRTQQRAVTEADWVAAAEQHREVHKAVATRRWTGSWTTTFITVDRVGGRSVDPGFEEELRAFLEPFRVAGDDLEIEPPRPVPLDIGLTVCVAPGSLRDEVKRALLDALGTGELPDGRRGFFHPDQFTFGQAVFLSRLVAAAMKVPGVASVDLGPTASLRVFQRLREPDAGELAQGFIPMGRLEIARLDNDPDFPENGRLALAMKGGA